MNVEKLTKNLEKNGFSVSYFETAKEAASYLNEKIDGKTVGCGGSVTVQEMGLMDMLADHNDCKWHWKGDTLSEAADTQVYLLSANGVAESGEIINIDGHGNRIASGVYGHKDVYYIIGKNKVAENFDKALYRARNIAAPKNAQRLSKKTPCAVKGDRCYDCSSPDRICAALEVLWRKPTGISHCEVVLINEELGF